MAFTSNKNKPTKEKVAKPVTAPNGEVGYPRFVQRWVDLIQMWDNVYDEYVNRHNPNRTVAVNKKLYFDTNFSYSETDNVTAFYVIDELPPEMELGYRSTLRSIVPQGVAMNFIEDNEPYQINWNDPAFKSRMDILNDVSKSSKEEQAGSTVYNSHKFQKQNEKDERMEQSIQYVQDATMSDEGRVQLYKIRVMIIITGKRGVDFTNTLKDFERMCEQRQSFSVRRITGQLTSTTRAFSPFTPKMSKEDKIRFRSTLSSDELRAQWHPFEQGVVGFGETYIGTNISTNSPVFKQFKRDVTDAEIVIVLGGSGSGKSYWMKVVAVQLCANPKIIMTINDYEGGEYAMLAKLVGKNEEVVELDFAQGSGRYIDPVPLVPVDDDDINQTLFSTARRNIIDLFRAVAGRDVLKERDWIGTIIERGVDMFYLQNGVTSDTSTWGILHDKTIYDVYNVMRTYKPEEDDVRFTSDFTYFLEKFNAYFDKSMKINNYFTKQVTLEQIVNAKLAVCNYNMRGIAEDSLSELDALLIPLNTSIISFYRTIYPYYRGKFNVKIWEELQRYESLGQNAITIIKTAITGGRKMGDINIVGSNDPTRLVDGSDKFSIFANYNTALVGKIKSPRVRENVLKALGIEKLADELDAIATVQEENDGIDVGYDEVFDEPYKKAFVAALDSGETVVVKADIPKWLSETPLFKTGVVVKES